MNTKILVIGAGAVGTNTSIFLASLGYHVTLLDAGQDILTGAPQVTFINHGDGFEYFKPEHTRTGEYCIEGSLTKALFYPFSALTTGVCSASNPIRFLVASGSDMAQKVSPNEFSKNVAHMQMHYSSKYKALTSSAKLSESDAETVFVRSPETFMRLLSVNEFEDVHDVVAGAYGVGFGINMLHYYALLKAALRKQRLECHFSVTVDSIVKMADGMYEVRAKEQVWSADQVLICSSHHIPQLASRIHGEALTRDFPGTYYLNCMTFLRLPATKVEERLRLSNKITFTLMGESGGMLASVVPPTAEEDGIAAIYYPGSKGSQLASHVCKRGDVSEPPKEWDSQIENGLPNDHPNVQGCFKQACYLYPYLRGYAEVSHTVCRTVFNIGVSGSNCGQDRRVRELSSASHAMTTDERVSAWTGPKWTNAELTALMAADYVLEHSGRNPLPKSANAGCGPSGLDVGKISNMFNFRNIKMNIEDARRYAKLARLPERMILVNLPQFQA